MTNFGDGTASYVFFSASRMFSVTGPVIRSPSAWRGDATNWMPKRPRSNTTVESTLVSASQALQPPALTCRSLSERPKSRFRLFVERLRKLQRIAAENQVVAFADREAVIVRERDRAVRTGQRAIAAEQASAEVDPDLPPLRCDGAGRASFPADAHMSAHFRRVDFRQRRGTSPGKNRVFRRDIEKVRCFC